MNAPMVRSTNNGVGMLRFLWRLTKGFRDQYDRGDFPTKQKKKKKRAVGVNRQPLNQRRIK